MRAKVFLVTVFLLVSVSLSAQESKKKEEFGVYMKTTLAHNYKFKLNSTLTDLGCKKIPDIFMYGMLGFYFGIKKAEITVDFGAGGLYSKTTRVFSSISNLSAGYKLTLPKKHSLIFAGNIAYEGYNVITRIEKGNLDFQNAVLTNSTAFHLELEQLMLGPKITWRNDGIYDISIGYDFGVMPMRWKSNTVNILNSPKERIDRIHIDFIIRFAL